MLYNAQTVSDFTPNQTKRERYVKQLASLKTERMSSWDTHYRDLADNIAPRRVRFQTTERNRGDKRNQKIINGRARLALRTAKSGMMGGITSPARPWFRLTTPDPDMAEFGPVKQWLQLVTNRMTEVFLRSNFYNALPVLYGDMITFATGVTIVDEDFKEVIRCFNPITGSYVLASNERLIVDTFMREFQLTVRQVVTKFGQYDPVTGRALWNNFSPTIRNMWDQQNYEAPVEIVHVIGPNLWRDGQRADVKNKTVTSCYYEPGWDAMHGFLREAGYDTFPVLAPRWDVAGEDVYGSDSPGWDALGDIKGLQVLEKRRAQATEKMLNPPMTAPTSLQNKKVSLIAGDVTFVDVREGQQGFRAAHEVNFPLNEARLDREELEERISRAFYEDLFLMLQMDERRQPVTAEEIRARHEEKLLAIGPVLERLNDELLNPAIARTFNIMVRFGMIPPPPQELQRMPLRVEYISIMAQAQKLVGLSGIERFIGFVSQAAQGQAAAGLPPTALDKLDIDRTIDHYGDITGVPPDIIVPEDKVKAIREQRAADQQKAQAAAMAQSAAQTGKTMSETDTSGDNALTRLMQLSQAGA